MAQLRSIRGRIALSLAALMLTVGALALVVVDQHLHPPSPVTWEDTLTSFLSDPLLGGTGTQLFLDQPTSGGGLTGGSAADGLFLVALWLALIPVSGGVAWSIAGRIVRPVVAIAEAAEDAGPSNPATRVPVSGRADEIDRLSRSFNGLLDRFERHDAERRRLVDDAAHEVRNPLAVMRTSLDVALADPDDPAALRAAAEVSQRAGDRIARTIDGLQAGFRRGEPRPVRSTVDLGDVVRELARDYAGVAARRGVTLEAATADGRALVADRDALKQALENLLVNAIRYAPPGSPVIVGEGAVPGWRWLGVRDFGAGIAPADQPLVFARGWRAPGTEGGNGIGLAVVRQIAEAHGGTVRLSSVPRNGSSFVLWLPVAEPDGTARQAIDGLPDPLWWPPTPVGRPSGTRATDPAARPVTLPA